MDRGQALDTLVVSQVAERFELDCKIVERVLRLLAQGKPAPYLARYRRDEAGGLDEWMLRELADVGEAVREMEQRREFILRAVAERGDVPEKMRRRIERCRSRTELEYLYEPYRPPRKTPGSVARERGFGPIAEAYLGNEAAAGDEEALRGAREILAERFAVDPEVRGAMLRVVEKEGVLTTAPAPGKKAIPDRFGALRTCEERLGRAPSHRFLALRRAEKEGALALVIDFPEEKVLAAIARRFYPRECGGEVKALLDQAAAYAVRQMKPAIFEDAMRAAKARADADAISVFRRNLHDLLLYPPAGAQRVMGVDPAPRGTIPFACVDERGRHLEQARLKLFGRNEEIVAEAKRTILRLVTTHGIALVALGNGAGRRECEVFLNDLLDELGEEAPPVVVVNEAGLRSYASGPVGRSELPALPVPVRGAVSLARRLMDPLAELVKVDPKQVGGGQYQSDLEPGQLARAVAEVAEHCVNLVGVDLNRASVQELAHVCGLTTSVARSLAEHRERSGPFPTISALRDLPFISETAFEYAAGFLRVRGGSNPLDATGVHPAHAPLLERIAADVGSEAGALVGNIDLLDGIVAEKYADETLSPSTVEGVLFELLEGGSDPRPPLEVVRRPAGVRSPADLAAGMQLPGRVTNVTSFGAFVDVGVKQDGLVHVSELADHFVKDPTSVVRVGQVVQVKVLGVDSETGRISLTMKSGRGPRPRREKGSRRAPRRDHPRRERPPREEEKDPAAAVAEASPPQEEPPAGDPVPSDMSEEEFMQRKLEELRKRFG